MTRVVRSEDRMVVTSPLKIKTRSRKPIKRDWDTDIEIERGGPSSSLVFRNLPEGETLEEFGAAGDGGGGWIRNQEINVHRFSEFLKARWSTYTLRCLHLLVAPQDISEPHFPMCALALAFVIILSLLCSIHVCSIKHVALEFASHNPSTGHLKTHCSWYYRHRDDMNESKEVNKHKREGSGHDKKKINDERQDEEIIKEGISTGWGYYVDVKAQYMKKRAHKILHVQISHILSKRVEALPWIPPIPWWEGDKRSQNQVNAHGHIRSGVIWCFSSKESLGGGKRRWFRNVNQIA